MYRVEHIGLPVLLDKLGPDSHKLPLTREPEAVERYLNHEVPGTHRLISVNRIEYPGLQDPRNVVYQFVWSTPE